MTLHHLDADLNVRVSTVRTRLRGHRSHRLKVNVYRWWDAVLDKSQALAIIRLNLADKINGYTYRGYALLQRDRPDIARQCPKDGLP